MATAVGNRYKPRDLFALPDPGRFELVDGQLVEQRMGAESSLVAEEIRLLIGVFSSAGFARNPE